MESLSKLYNNKQNGTKRTLDVEDIMLVLLIKKISIQCV